jgi:hypothetical protein
VAVFVIGVQGDKAEDDEPLPLLLEKRLIQKM